MAPLSAMHLQRYRAWMRHPASRRQRARSALNDPRRLSRVMPTAEARARLAANVHYVPYAKHKKHPDAYSLKAYEGEDEDATYCDDHAGFRPADMDRVSMLLQRGVHAGLFGQSLKAEGDPGMIWTVDDNGWIYEGELTNPGYGGYHGYPVLPNEAIAKRVLARYADYLAELGDPFLNASLRLARKRYQ